MSLRLRLALLSGFAVFAVVALFGAGVYLVLATRLSDQVDENLTAYALEAQQRLELPRFITDPSLPRPLPDDPNTFAILYEGSGTEVTASPNAVTTQIRVPDRAWSAALHGKVTSVFVNSSDGRYRLRVGPAPAAATGDLPRVLVVGESMVNVDYTLSLLRFILAAGGGLALLFAGLLGWVVAGRSLRPVSVLTRAAERIGDSGDPSLRLPSPRRPDEIGRLSGAFNASLDRLETVYRALEEALHNQRRFVADASHELRTPLTVILNDAENLRDHPEIPGAERQEYLEELVFEAKRMARMTADLLGIARGDAGGALDVGDVNWDAFFAEIGHDATRICAPRNVTVLAPRPLGTGTGDEAALRRAFRVLFDNVARHTPPSAEVTLRGIAGSGDEIRISVSDTGPGVDGDDLPRIFDRFFRADPSRHGRGAGLGLAIAKSVIERHTGEVSAHNRQPHGLTVEARLPREQEATPISEPGQLVSP